MHFSHFIKTYFTFSKSERNGIYILLVILCGVTAFRMLSPALPHPVTSIPEKKDSIELNSADTSILVKLKGIGPVLSTRIIKYRELLGGFYDKYQLAEVYGIDSGLVGSFNIRTYTDTMLIRKIDINFADFRTILRHPYISYEITKKIIRHRERSGNFKSLDDPALHTILGDTLYHKILSYLELKNE